MNVSTTNPADTIPQLTSLGNVVPEGYEYREKVITPREGLSLPGAYLKWYDINLPGVEITQEQVAESRRYLAAEVEAGRLKLEDDLGFVLLHRAGPMLLLMVIVWRNTNELWESTYLKEAASAEKYRPSPLDRPWGTYCVWELGAVWHERNAWVRFIQSERDDEAKLAYLNDHFSGRV
jgi:hypothetical protein